MTRINLIPPGELCDQHLLAEYRELPRIFGLAKICDHYPESYFMGTGHVKFFYNKLKFLEKRHKKIVSELITRGFSIYWKEPPKSEIKELYNDYEPTEEAIALNKNRISERMPEKPRYRKGNKYDYQI